MTKPIHFEKTMIELEEIVMQLEKGELTLEDSLKQFEKGITLARRCQEVLSQAEQKIEMLTLSNLKDSEQFDDQ
ncbi:exodeoxyribonuclease VII small subunit [Legionella tunisiensis]|uniref:exodeoxyribonuclease VII small subunit n=1 Tax=Legionella tunisiensis TaxID=1034944 RepID=UPI00047531FC|nr:exodeoxyribonuclease VII small subunit [Legionella tunisiensis]